jgi:YD repeat-containing protein
MKKTLLLFLVLFSLANGYAQSTSFEQTQDNIPKIIPPSPNDAAFEKFTTIPVDYSTGVPSISYPMWSWQRGKLNFSLGLAYHAGGHKVDDMASNTGLGWALNGIGRVSRTVKGLPDDKAVSGFINSPALPEQHSEAYIGTEYYFTSPFLVSQQYGIAPNVAVTALNSPNSNIVRDIAENQLDGEQDIFSYSFNGASGRFLIDKQKTIVPLEQTNSKIEIIYINPSAQTGILGFKITDDKGIVYQYDHAEQQSATSITDPASFSTVQSYVSGWLLTHITDPLTGDAINITYANNWETKYETGFSEHQTYVLEHADHRQGLVIPGVQLAEDTYSYSIMEGNEPAVSSISFPDGSALDFMYDFDREDLKNSKALTQVQIKNLNNNIVKTFKLNYSYFSCSAPGVSMELSSPNNYSMRLRLDEADEVSNDGTLTKPTIFTYNSTLLNKRSSKNIDFWGYNVNPNRNNGYYVPEVPVEEPEQFMIYSAYFGGADRKPDEEYMKAAILEKIQYPTGGFTKFEYEANRAYSAVDYYVDQLNGNNLSWEQPSFGQSPYLYLPSRTKEGVEFNFRVEEFDPRPAPDPNAPQSCFSDGQDLQPASFLVQSTDNTVSFTVSDVYSHFLGLGQTRTFDLPLDKTYRVRFSYDATVTCSFLYPFKASATTVYFTAPHDKIAGGLRIKKISTDDGGGHLLTKEYNYNNPDGNSSATLATVPNFGYYRTTIDETQGINSDGIFLIRKINRISSPTNTVNFSTGSPLIYSKVRETEKDGSLIERYYDPAAFALTGGNGYFPYLPYEDFPLFCGLMTRQIIKDKDGITKKDEQITYEKTRVNLLNQSYNRNIKTGVVATAALYPATYYVADQYWMSTTRVLQTAKTTSVYEDGNVLTQTENKSYDPVKYYLHAEATTNSKNEQRATEYTYASDAVGTAYTVMASKNMSNYLTGTLSYIPNVVNGELSRSATNYGLFSPNNIPSPATVQSAVLGNTLETDLTFNAYDDKNNILQYTGKDGVVNSFVWGYNKQYPVAKIIGKSYVDVISQSGIDLSILNAPANDAAMRTELNKLRTLSSCLMTTYTDKPLVGTTSETDPNGRTKYYEYDAFNRLNLIRDQDNNILKKICYNYQGQQTECTETIVLTGTGSPACNTSNCSGADKKCINGACQTSPKYYTSSVRTGPHTWECTYYYYWTDGSTSPTYTETGSSYCLLMEPF